MNIGLVLSGGMAKGAYQIGALKALEEFIPRSEIQYISCASVGVLNGYAYATGKLTEAEKMWRNVCCNDSRVWISQLMRSSMLQREIKNICSDKDKLPKYFYGSLLDYKNSAIVYKNFASVGRGQRKKHLKASVAMPIYNHPVNIGGIPYYDGAMADNIPIFPLIKHSLDYIICIYFDDCIYTFENPSFDSHVIKLTFPCESRLRQSLLMTPESIDKMISDGYDRTTYALNAVLGRGYDNLDFIYSAITYRNSENQTRTTRITGDVIVSGLNRVAKTLARKKVIK